MPVIFRGSIWRTWGGWRFQTSPKSYAQPRSNRSSNWPVGTAYLLIVVILFSVTPVSALSDFANEQQVDVIVMGRVQYHGLEKLLGSTTEHILYQVPCSVLAV